MLREVVAQVLFWSTVLEVLDLGIAFWRSRWSTKMTAMMMARATLINTFAKKVARAESLVGSCNVGVDVVDVGDMRDNACIYTGDPAHSVAIWIEVGVHQLRFGFTYSMYVIGHELGHQSQLLWHLNSPAKGKKRIHGLFASKIREYMADYFGVCMVAKYVPSWRPGQIFLAEFLQQWGSCSKGVFGFFLSDHPEDICRCVMILAFEIIAWFKKAK